MKKEEKPEKPENDLHISELKVIYEAMKSKAYLMS